MTWFLLIRSSLSSLTPRTVREFGTQVQEVRAGEMVNSELFQMCCPGFLEEFYSALSMSWNRRREARSWHTWLCSGVTWLDSKIVSEGHQYLQGGWVSQKWACCCPWNYVSRGYKMIQFRSTDISWACAVCQTWGTWRITHGSCLQGAYHLIGKDRYESNISSILCLK